MGDGPRQCNGSGLLLPRHLPLLPGPLFHCPTFYVFYFYIYLYFLLIFPVLLELFMFKFFICNFFFSFQVFFSFFFPFVGPPDLAPPGRRGITKPGQHLTVLNMFFSLCI